MKKKFKRILASLMVAVMVLSAAPLSGFAGIDLPDFSDVFSTKAEAADDRMLGDVNCDGAINSTDALLVLKHSCGISQIGNEDFEYADANKNSKVTSFDALLILYVTVEIIVDGLENLEDYYFRINEKEPILYYETLIRDNTVCVSVYVESGVAYALDMDFQTNGLKCKSITIDKRYIDVRYSNINEVDDCFNVHCVSIDGIDADLSEPIVRAEFEITGTLYSEPFTMLAYDCDRELTVNKKTNTFTYELNENNEATVTGYNGDIPNEIVIPSTIDGYRVIAIGDYAFENGETLTNVYIPDGVTSIGEGAFFLTGLETVRIPESVTTMGYAPFGGCFNLTEIVVDEDNTMFLSDEAGALFDKDKTVLIQYPVANTRPSYTVPTGVERIDYYAFIKSTHLTSVELPESLKFIADEAFALSGITSIYIPENVEIIDYYAFNGCENLEEVTFADESNTHSISRGVFQNCTKLKNIDLPDNYSYIHENTFSGCVSLESVKLGENVTWIEHAFQNCVNLTEVTLYNKVERICSNAFNGCDNITDVYYYGTEEEWNEIIIDEEGNTSLLNATIHFLGEHKWEHITVPSTCTVPGVEYDMCSECGEIANQSFLPLADHAWGDWTVIRESTTEHEGLKQRMCSACGATEDESIPKLKQLVDEKSGIEIEYEDEYDSGVEIVVTDVYDGNVFQLINLHNGNCQSKIFDITTVKDGKKVQPNGKVKVRIPLPEGFGTKNIFINYIDTASQKVTSIPARVANGYIEFETEHFSYYAIVEKLGKVNSVSVGNISMNYKDSTTVTPSINADEGVKYTVSYSSSDTGIAQVDANGKITATGKGNATITVTVKDQYGNTVTDTCNVEVKYSWWQWIIVIVLFGWIWY